MLARYFTRYFNGGGRTVLAAWIITRALMLLLMATTENFATGDVFYYWRKLAGMSEVGLTETMNEYPTPVVWILWLPYGVTGGSRTGYFVAFVAFMIILDALFSYLLWRTAGRKRDRALDFWVLFVFLVGPLSYMRFDILPAVLVGTALLLARTRPWITGALTGLGAAIKLWPALLIGAFLAAKEHRRPVGLGFVGGGVGLAIISLIIGGGKRLVSPLSWQSGRGLQIESIWATPLMVIRTFSPDEWFVDISKFQAYEIFGAGVGPLLTASTVATVAGLGVIIALTWRLFHNPAPSPVAVGLVIMAIVAIMIITNKTLSPQYLLWAGGPMAALLSLKLAAPIDHLPEPDRRLIRRLALQLLVLALLTHLVYPTFYYSLLGINGPVLMIIATIILTVRNLAVILFTVEICRLAWIRARPKARA